MLVHNEDEFVERALRNALPLCDHFHVADHMSIDGTWDVIRRMSAELPTVEPVRVRDTGDSHALVEGYAGTDTWVFGVDGDELYDPARLARFREDLLGGAYREFFSLKSNVLNVTELDTSNNTATGYLAPPSRSITKLFNFAAIDAWANCHRQYMHDGDIAFRPGYTRESIGVLGDRFGWDDSPLRCLHACFLRRSSLDPPEIAGRSRLSPSERVAMEARQVSAWRPVPNGHNGILPMTLPSLSIVVSTYEWPGALDAVLFGLSEQSDRDFDVVVADDGSGPATGAVVERWQTSFGSRLQHVRQADDGFRLARVKNLGVQATKGRLLISMDGDAVPRRGFVHAMRASALPGWFLGGKRLELSRELSDDVLTAHVPIHRWSLLRWSRERRRAGPLDTLTPRDRRRPGRDGLPDFVPHANRYGVLFGVFREDFVRANGFDMRYEGWGEEDVDLAFRLRRLGLRCGWAGPASTLLHLWHERAVRGRPSTALLAETRASDRVEAVAGLRELAQESANSTTGSLASRPLET
jgi:glycosyltransferase involved in cell wall biosynthesis